METMQRTVETALPRDLKIVVIHSKDKLPMWASPEAITNFLNATLKPYHDSLQDIERVLDYAFSRESGKGGLLVLAERDGTLAGALVILRHMSGDTPPQNLLVFSSVAADLRGIGLGNKLLERAIRATISPVKRYAVPHAGFRQLYERLGLNQRYAELRYNG